MGIDILNSNPIIIQLIYLPHLEQMIKVDLLRIITMEYLKINLQLKSMR
jgi:hypothetical protein